MSESDDIDESMLASAFEIEDLGEYILFDDIDGVTAKDLYTYITKMNAITDLKCIKLHIMSYGGEVHAGMSIIDAINKSRIPIHTHISGTVMSMGGAISIAGKRGFRTMCKNSIFMAHQFTAANTGKHHELVSTRKYEDWLDTMLVAHYVKYSKLSEKKVRSILLSNSDVYLTPKECLDYGLIDKIV